MTRGHWAAFGDAPGARDDRYEHGSYDRHAADACVVLTTRSDHQDTTHRPLSTPRLPHDGERMLRCDRYERHEQPVTDRPAAGPQTRQQLMWGCSVSRHLAQDTRCKACEGSQRTDAEDDEQRAPVRQRRIRSVALLGTRRSSIVTFPTASPRLVSASRLGWVAPCQRPLRAAPPCASWPHARTSAFSLPLWSPHLKECCSMVPTARLARTRCPPGQYTSRIAPRTM
jgi:hypothetical protein